VVLLGGKAAQRSSGLFEQHGAIDEVHLMIDRMTGKSRGFGFVTMYDGVQGNAGMSNRPRAKSHEAKTENLIKE